MTALKSIFYHRKKTNSSKKRSSIHKSKLPGTYSTYGKQFASFVARGQTTGKVDDYRFSLLAAFFVVEIDFDACCLTRDKTIFDGAKKGNKNSLLSFCSSVNCRSKESLTSRSRSTSILSSAEKEEEN